MAKPSALLLTGLVVVLAATACQPDRDDDMSGETPRGPGPGPVGPPPQMEGESQCKKVDVLFVIDNSGSMADNQRSLIASFPGFVAGMREQLKNAVDFHVGIVTSDDYLYNDMGCKKIGALVTKTGGPESSRMACGPFPGNERFLTNTDPMLSEHFACAAQVGAGGSDDERMARGLLAALSPEMSKPGGCNAGFLRPDSLLVTVLITDEDDVPEGCDGDGTCMTKGSGGTPAEWFAEMVKYRGRPENIVMLSLLGQRGDNPCGAVAASKLIGLTRRFGENGYLGDICATSYDKFFVDALPVIKKACQVYIPG